MGHPRRLSGFALCAAALMLSLPVCTALWAAQRPLKSKAHNYAGAPVLIKQSKVELVETFATPTQVGTRNPSVRGSRIRHANRAGLLPSRYVLQGELLCRNQAPGTVEALELSIVALDAFHRPLQPRGQVEAYAEEQVMETLPRGASKRISWQLPIASADVYEVAVIVTRVRFSDGTVWLAPEEELIDSF